MFFERKMKKQNVLKSIWFPVVLLVIFFTTLGLFGPGPALFAVRRNIPDCLRSCRLLTFIRTRNPGQLVLTLYIFLLAWYASAHHQPLKINPIMGFDASFFS